MESSSYLLWLLPVLTVVVTLLGNLFLRRTGKESNGNDQFKIITDALFTRAELQDKTIKEMQIEITGLKKSVQDASDIAEKAEEANRDLRRVNAALVRYISKLTRFWPQGTTLPEPDESLI